MNRTSNIDGIAANTSALQVFYQSSALRYRHPLGTGLYKLKEGVDGINSLLITYRTGLSAHLTTAVQGNCNKSPVTSDFDECLMAVPEYTAYYLGYNVLPGLSALINEGVSHHEMTKMVQQFLDFVPPKLKVMDSIWLKLARAKSYKSEDLLDLERVCDELLKYCEDILSQLANKL